LILSSHVFVKHNSVNTLDFARVHSSHAFYTRFSNENTSERKNHFQV